VLLTPASSHAILRHVSTEPVNEEPAWRNILGGMIAFVGAGVLLYLWFGSPKEKHTPAAPEALLTESTLVAPPPARSQQPEARSADQERLAKYERLVIAAREQGVIGAEEYINGQVIVQPAFYSLTFKEKQGLCIALSYSAAARGGSKDFTIRDGMANRRVGSFVDGTLDLK
jgi:hypothetical protein